MKIITVGENKVQFSAKPSCTYGLNSVIDGSVMCVAESEKRKKLLESISKRKEKIPLSYMQQAFKEAGFNINNDSDSDEEEDEEKEEKKEENQENKETSENNDTNNINQNAAEQTKSEI